MMRIPKSISGFFVNSNAALLLALFLFFFFGCSASDTRVKKSEQDNRVNSISAVDEGNSIKVEVLGDGPFTFEYSKQVYPLSLILYLQGASSTDVEIGEIEGGDIVSDISSAESGENPPVSRIEISLKKDVPYNVYAEGNALYVSLSKTAEALAGMPPDTEEGGGEGIVAKSDIEAQPVATNAGGVKNLSTVEAEKEAGGVIVFVRADGEVADFESFTVEETIESPARIVFDIFNVNTPTDEEQRIDVGSEWVDAVRYKGYKDRIRLVLDTRNQYLTSFFGMPSEDGLKIMVGDTAALASSGRGAIDSDSGRLAESMGERALEESVPALTEASALPLTEESAPPLTEESAPPLTEDSAPPLTEEFAPPLTEDSAPSLAEESLPAAAAPVVSRYSEAKGYLASDGVGPEAEAVSEIESQAVSAVGHAALLSGMADATALSSVTVSPFGKSLIVRVNADGPVREYNAFSIEESEMGPARIVVDMYRLKSPFENERVIPVDFDMIDRVRHLGHSDKVRLVIDTRNPMITNFVAEPVAEGLEIKVGPPVPLEGSPPATLAGGRESVVPMPISSDSPPVPVSTSPPPAPVESVVSNTGTAEPYSGPNRVNRIDFSSLPGGRSTLVVGAAKPIRYQVQEVSDRKIIVRLLDTRIAEPQKRPLITTRFESAVDRILPIQTDSMKDSILSIELREKTPYRIEPMGNELRVAFEASSIPPKPFEEAGLPSWRQAMSEPLAEVEAPAAAAPSGRKAGVAPERREVAASVPMEPEKKYTGEKIALDFFETDIKNVFRILREVSGKNFAIDKDVTGTVTLTLEKPVPWDQVLDLILKMNQLGKVEEGDIIRIAKMATITKEERDRQAKIAAEAQAREQEKAVEPLFTEYIPINYSDAKSEILPHLQNIATKERGSLSVDARTNTVIMTDTKDKIRQAREIVGRLDKVTPQVIIEARIVEASSSFSREIGIEWTTEGGIPNDDANAGYGPQRGYDTLGGTWAYDTAVNLPVTDAGSIGFQFKRIFGTPLTIDARLGAMESQGEGKIVSAPKVMTLDNKKATIKQGREVPYSTEDDDGNTVVEFKEVDLLLEVTPHVTPDNRISLRVFITKNEIAEFSVDGVPSLATKEAETELLVNDGETIVIGGILQTTDQETTEGIPGLYKIPVLSWLFKSEVKSSRKDELLIFLTPRIMQLEQRNI